MSSSAFWDLAFDGSNEFVGSEDGLAFVDMIDFGFRRAIVDRGANNLVASTCLKLEEFWAGLLSDDLVRVRR